MSQLVLDPPIGPLLADGGKLGGWWHPDPATDRIVCDLCPRECHLKHGDRGFCFVRENRDGQMVLSTYGRSTGFCIDPIEKKPLNHFLPGTSVLSFGTAGCNLGCKFCQNHDISKARETELLSQSATPEAIAEAAVAHQCASVAFTYNDPVIWAEYAMDTARACRDRGIKTVAVTAGYITPVARKPFFDCYDAANVDLKGFTEEFYQQLTLSHLQPVLDTLHWLKHESDVWFEITNLVIPRANDSPDELKLMCEWILSALGDRVPIHFTAFHPDFRLLDRPSTPHETLLMAYEVARGAGLKFVYVGNVDDVRHQTTYCPGCGELLIERNWYDLGIYQLEHDRCRRCGEQIPGRFQQGPGTWGRRRQPVNIAEFHVQEQSSPAFTDEQHRNIHALASEVVASTIQQRAIAWESDCLGEAGERWVHGAYVSLKRRGRLRSCCGFVNRRTTLRNAIVDAAQRSASDDMRLPPISATELPFLELETWLLGQPQKVSAVGHDRVRAIQVGRHGLLISMGTQRGLLLPGVAIEHQYDAETFLMQVCRKAGLRPDAWLSKDTELYIFEGASHRAPLASQACQRGHVESRLLYTDQELVQLHAWLTENFFHALRGSTPNYYLPTINDAMVHLAAVLVGIDPQAPPESICKVSLRPAMPLQATLSQLVQLAADRFRDTGNTIDARLQIDLVIGHDPAMHNSLRNPELGGFEPRHRGMFAVNTHTWAVAFRPQDPPEDSLRQLTNRIARSAPTKQADLYSLTMQSTRTPCEFGNPSSSERDRVARTAAVAGRFYPGNADAMRRALDEIFRGLPMDPIRRRVRAVMVPHAGWIYSGRLAAEVFYGVQIPDRIIVIGPKHTPAGADHAVAPHHIWRLPGLEVASDLELAGSLVHAIPQWEWDRAAHAGEHAIEVEIPIIHRLAPQCRIVGVALGQATWESCLAFSRGLASVLRGMEDPPLLVISSDMNHFASDPVNRCLDELAIQALETCNPEHAYRFIRGERISMCGVIPAVVVMQTLKELGQLESVTRVNYGTSADVSGDISCVVGYAGLWFT